MTAQLIHSATTNAFSTTLDGSIDSDDATIALTSVGTLQSPGIILIDRQNGSNVDTPTIKEYVLFTGITGSQLTGCTRGLGNSTAQSHASGALVEEVLSVTHWEDLIDFLEIGHEANGTHKTFTSPKIATAITDSNGNEIIKTPATASAINEITVTNAAAGNAVGISTTGGDDNIGLTITPKGTGKIKIKEGGVDPWRTIYLGAGVFKPTTTGGCGSVATVEAGTNDIDYDVIDFDKASDENAFCNFHMPESWDAGVIQFRFDWTAAAGTAAQTVVLELSGTSYANDDAIDTAVGTAIEVSDALITTGDVHTSAWSGDVTLAGTPSAGEYVHLEIMRDVSEDNLDADARIIGVQIRYKQTQFSD